jgi:hypothetical protein
MGLRPFNSLESKRCQNIWSDTRKRNVGNIRTICAAGYLDLQDWMKLLKKIGLQSEITVKFRKRNSISHFIKGKDPVRHR